MIGRSLPDDGREGVDALSRDEPRTRFDLEEPGEPVPIDDPTEGARALDTGRVLAQQSGRSPGYANSAIRSSKPPAGIAVRKTVNA